MVPSIEARGDSGGRGRRKHVLCLWSLNGGHWPLRGDGTWSRRLDRNGYRSNVDSKGGK